MIARELSRKIQIYKTSSVEDGFGGYTIDDVLIGSFWAKFVKLVHLETTQTEDLILKTITLLR